MSWKSVGEWLKKNGGNLVGMAGAIATGNIPAGVAAVASMVTEATGESKPELALAKLQADPQAVLRFEELCRQSEADIRAHHREMLRLELDDAQKSHAEQQNTIRSGDSAEDEYVRHTRPMMARQSWWATGAYVLLSEGAKIAGYGDGCSFEAAMVLVSPAAAYIGFRSVDHMFGKFKKKAA
jgi:hypothetical protein